MAYIPINLLNVQPSVGFTVFPIGLYSLRVLTAQQGVSKSSNEPTIKVTFEVIDGPDGGPQYAGQKLVRSYSLKENALGFFKSLLFALGFTDQFLASQQGMVAEEQLIGLTMKGRVTQREYQGKMQNEVEAILPGNTPAAAPAPSAQTFAPPTQAPQYQQQPQQQFAAPPVAAPQYQQQPQVPQFTAPAPTPGAPSPGFAAPPAAPGTGWPAGAPGMPQFAAPGPNGAGFPPAPPPPPRS